MWTPCARLSSRPLATFAAQARPQSAADRSALSSFRGDASIALADARLLGTDGRGRHFMLVDAGDQVCLVVISGPEQSGTACDHRGSVSRDGLWLKYGQGDDIVVAIAIPDAHRDARLQAEVEPVVRTPDLVVLPSRRDTSEVITLASARFPDLRIASRKDPERGAPAPRP